MDKRKVNGGGAQVDDLDDRAAKRRRTSVSLHSILLDAMVHGVVRLFC